jgi:hypothetical protein
MVLAVYGLNGTAACVTCGFSNVDALELDHVNDNGAEERRKNPSHVGVNLAMRLHLRSYPAGYQTLCCNCNWIKEIKRRRAQSEARALEREQSERNRDFILGELWQ